MILLDTCTLLWLAADERRLSATAREAIAANAGELFLSSISAFEIGVKHHKGNLELPLPPRIWVGRVLEQHGIVEIPVNCAIATASTALPRLHGDPCDRIIVATAQLHDLTILTPDTLIRAYPNVSVDW